MLTISQCETRGVVLLLDAYVGTTKTQSAKPFCLLDRIRCIEDMTENQLFCSGSGIIGLTRNLLVKPFILEQVG